MTSWLHLCTDDNKDNDDYRCSNIRTGRLISASLSLVGCLLALLVIVVYKKFRFFTQRLVMYLLCSCMFIALFSLHNIAGDSPGCTAKGFFRNVAGLSQNLWIICIDVHLLIVMMKSSINHYQLEKIYHGVVWGLTIVLSIIPLIGNHYGHAGIWCWIKGDSNYENVLRVICYYFWLMLLVFGGAVIYVYIVYKVMKKINSYDGPYNPDTERSKQQYKKSIKPLLLYPIVDLILASVSTANRIQNWANPGNPVYELALAHSIVSPLWGFVNALLFLLNKETIKQLHPVSFWQELKHWSKTTFTFTKSVETKSKNMDYTVKDEKPPEEPSAYQDQSFGDMD
ncbi:hypothetical protein ACHWQZ_G010052 [Mnemiopsis leidyi]